MIHFHAAAPERRDHFCMATVIQFPLPPVAAREPTLREVLQSLGIEPTGETRRRRRREAARRLREEGRARQQPPPDPRGSSAARE